MLGKRKVPARAYVAQFNFKGPDQEKKVGNLSGGERNRVHLAKLLKSGGNLLLLDEPTNDLDVEMLRALEEALVDFGGCAVVISHDRWFLDRIATHILAFEGDSRVVWCDGNYQTYEAQRHERLGIDADQPHRIRYKSLTPLMVGQSAIGRPSVLPVREEPITSTMPLGQREVQHVRNHCGAAQSPRCRPTSIGCSMIRSQTS